MTAAVAVIPARGGSKRLPRKNVLPLGGHPLIAYTIAAARSAAGISGVFVSTDDDEIAATAKAWGAEVIRRPPELAQDTSPIDEALAHSLAWIRSVRALDPGVVAWLQPDVPIRRADTIDRAVDLLRTDRTLTGAATGYRVSQHPAWMKTLDGDGNIVPLHRGVASYRQQDLPELFLLDGAVVAFRAENLDCAAPIGVHTYLGPRARILLHEHPMFSLNIDTGIDFELAGLYLARYPQLGLTGRP